MFSISRLRWLGLFFIMLPAAAQMAAPNAVGKNRFTAHWLNESDKAKLFHSIPPAPAPGSTEDQRDLQGVLKAQASRTSQEIAEARFDQKFRLEIVTNVLDPSFNSKNDPLTFAFLENALQDEGWINFELKETYRRPRPYEAHAEVKALFPVRDYSYPSGHASGGYVLAAILGELLPDQKTALMARADAVAQSRVVAGAHYPSDIEQGKILGEAIFKTLMAKPAFQHDLTAAKAEVVAKNVPKN